MTAYDYDLFVIGAGSGGVRASRIAAGYGARVAVAEEYRVGGTCVIRGCVPKKLLVYASHMAEEFEDAAGFGWQAGQAALDWATLRDNVQNEVARLNGLYIQTLDKAGVDILPHRATFLDAHTLQVGDRQITARTILIATGARPAMPDCEGEALGFTSNEAFHLDTLPRRMIIAGGGYISTEFAGIFHGLGVEVTNLYRGDLILKGWDRDIRERIQAAYAAKGVRFHLNTVFRKIERQGETLLAHLKDGTTLETDAIMYAIGRKPNTRGLGLEAAGVTLGENEAVAVNAASQTNVPHIYAVGDVTDRVQLTPVAIREGHAFADTVFGGKPWVAAYDAIPSAVFSQPPAASVGLTEEKARATQANVLVYRADFRPMKYVLGGRTERALCKLIVDADTDRVLGAHMVGPDSAEIIQALAIAVKMGATKAQFDATVALHPSSAEEFVLMRAPS